MFDFIREISIFVSVGAIIVIIILWVRTIFQEKRFRFIRESDAKRIEDLAREREELRKELIAKLDMLSKSSDLERNTLLEIIKRKDDKREEEREDLINWLEYRMTRMGEEIENKIKDRLARILIQIEDINTRLLKIEKQGSV